MNQLSVRFKKLSPKIGTLINEPFYATEGSAGIDLSACIDESVTIGPNEWKRIPTGLAMEINNHQIVGLVFPRSGLANRFGITLQNAVGVIDSDYRGPIDVLIRNEGTDTFTIKDGDRIAQLVFMPIIKASIDFVEDLNETTRGTGGFGSTGV